jgi:hypothetical protein
VRLLHQRALEDDTVLEHHGRLRDRRVSAAQIHFLAAAQCNELQSPETFRFRAHFAQLED